VAPAARRRAVGSRLAADAPVRELAGVGPARAEQLAAAGCETVRDLLWHLPLRWEDRRRVTPIGSLREQPAAPVVTVVGRLRAVRSRRIRGRKWPLSEARVEDDTGAARAIWFDRPYLERQIEPGSLYLLSGHLRTVAGEPELLNPSLEPWSGAPPACLTPVYPRLGTLGPAAARRLVDAALERTDLDALDPLPPALLERRRLLSLGAALGALHRPDPEQSLEALVNRTTPAHRRLAYGELFGLQLRLATRRELSRRRPKPRRYVVDDRVRALAREMLPFPLTAAQRRCVRDLVDDLRSPHAMARLLQGDVGAGKTLVAALAMIVALANGHQVAFMAPTELLAEQHRRSLDRLLGPRFPVELWTRSTPDRTATSRRAASGAPLLAVGTHALFESSIRLPRLGLVVIDEQHRFGVEQRRRLASKAHRPDLLVMTATPIPRSLALVLYGDLDLSILDELPPGRRPVSTRLLEAAARDQVLELVREHRARGGRTLVVFPRIAPGEALAPAVETVGRWYLERLGELRGACLTGRMPAAERERVLSDLGAGTLDLLVATTVVEVGLDVPTASLMVIEGAEAFGLSQLHQLRGRVGRGALPSECVAVTGTSTPDARRRLELFAACADGFRIAEADLALRGPGDLLGVRQAGAEPLRVADLARHADLLEAAREDARELARSAEPRRLGDLAGAVSRGLGRRDAPPCEDPPA
jgi:ATP-dependent DNA helicase RecG